MTFIHKKHLFIKNVHSKRTHRWPTWPCFLEFYWSQAPLTNGKDALMVGRIDKPSLAAPYSFGRSQTKTPDTLSRKRQDRVQGRITPINPNTWKN